MVNVSPEVRVLADRDELSLAAAEEFARVANASVAERERCDVALSGGSTPKELFALLASEAFRRRVAWDKLRVFWGDERHVPPDDAQSNYRMARESLLSRVPIPPENIHRVPAERADAEQVAADYQRTLRTVFQLSPGEAPRFDLVLLGLGPDGHTASLFPGTVSRSAGTGSVPRDGVIPAETEQFVAAPWVEKFGAHRITLTPTVLNHARRVVFLVSGAEKAAVLCEVLQGPFEPERLPAQFVRPERTAVLWLVDRAAARDLHAD
ncbi:MAG TPA: 6-phosphogluconolactonase [Pirellulales bacterium]|nr:6-phosphogluconolactonase [Pirellulales bacterium]